ncbi:MAG: hypothetical protein FWD24_08255, partial [Treponema sp.]|nr:hypothetical protein [Treponema sp.]
MYDFHEGGFTHINIPSGMGAFYLQIDDVKARAIMPQFNVDLFEKFILDFIDNATNEIIQTVERTSGNLDNPVFLFPGNYRLKISAFTLSANVDPAAVGESGQFNISTGNTTFGNVELEVFINDGGTGTFSWKLTTPENFNLEVQNITITHLNYDPVESIDLTFNTVNGVDISEGFRDNLTSGYYRVTLTLIKDTQTDPVIVRQFLHIYKDMESKLEMTFNNSHFGIFGTIDEVEDFYQRVASYATATSDVVINVSSSLLLYKVVSVPSNPNGHRLIIQSTGIPQSLIRDFADTDSDSGLFTIPAGARVTFDNILIEGANYSGTTSPLVNIQTGGVLTMNDVSVTGTPNNLTDVFVSVGAGTFTLSGNITIGALDLVSNGTSNSSVTIAPPGLTGGSIGRLDLRGNHNDLYTVITQQWEGRNALQGSGYTLQQSDVNRFTLGEFIGTGVNRLAVNTNHRIESAGIDAGKIVKVHHDVFTQIALFRFATANTTITLNDDADFLIRANIPLPQVGGSTLTIRSSNPSARQIITRRFSDLANSGLFMVPTGVTLIFEEIIVDGDKGTHVTNAAPLVRVDGGTFTMRNGAVLRNNRASNGGGVNVVTGTFVMSGGEISDNTATGNGGGVYKDGSGLFTMSGGKINGNFSNSTSTT